MCTQVHACVWWQWKGLLGADSEVCREKGGEGGRGSGLYVDCISSVCIMKEDHLGEGGGEK